VCESISFQVPEDDFNWHYLSDLNASLNRVGEDFQPMVIHCGVLANH